MLQRCLAALTFLAGALFGPALFLTASAQSLPSGMARGESVEGITEYRLANGLQVLLVPDDSKPTTTVNMTYRVGSRMESYGETGMAHLLEHLLFKGSKKHPLVWAEFNKRGLAANGSTGFDRTNYFASFAANEDNLRWYLGWQADAMVNSFIAKKDLDSEMTVVRNEMEMGENDPGRTMWQHALAVMYSWHNYGKPTIGARADVENVDIGRLQDFYRRYYQPDNATLIISGKFDQAKTLRWIAEAFGPIPKPQRTLPRLYTLDPAQDGERSFTVRRVGGTPSLLVGYHVPEVADPRYPAAEAVALILGDEPSGRLHRALVQKQLAAGIWAFAWDLADPGVMLLGAQLAPGQDVQAARQALIAAAESFSSEPVTSDELSRAKAKWLKAWDMRFMNAERVGVALSDTVGQGDWRLFFLLRDRVKALTVEQVQAFAQQWLLQSNRTVGEYVPTERPQRAPAPDRVDLAAQFKDFKPQDGLAQAEAFDATPANIDARTQRFSVDDGAGGAMQVALLPKSTRGDAVHAQLVLRFGDVGSLAGKESVAELLAAMLDKGTKRLSRQQVQDRLDELRTEISISGGADMVNVGLTGRRDSLPAAIELVGEILREPALAPEVLEELRQQALSSVQANRQEPEAVAANQLARHGDPYPKGDVRHARTFDEIEADLKAVTLEQLRDFHRRFLGVSHAQFAAVGDMDVEAVRRSLGKALGGWKSEAPYARIPNPPVTPTSARLVARTPDKQNAVLSVRQTLPLTDLHPDYPSVTLANWLLGGAGGDSRLWKRIREKEGLSYSVHSFIAWSNFEPNSPWNAGAIFAPQNRAKVETAFAEEVARALKDGFSEDEVRAGIGGLLNFRKLSRAQDSRLASALVSNLYLERTFAITQRVDEAISKLTAAEVNAALRKYIRPESFVSSLAGDFRE